MENWNSKFLKLKSLIPQSYYQDSKVTEYKKSEISVIKSPKFLNKVSKNSLLGKRVNAMAAKSLIVQDQSFDLESDLEGKDPIADPKEPIGATDPKEEKLSFNFNIQKDHLPQGKVKKRDAQGQLATILKKKQKIKELEKVDPTKSLELSQDHEWKKAQALAIGKKVKDDPNLLRKSIQRTRTMKKKSEKEWKNRIKNTATSIKERQKKRTQNIQNKKARNSKGKGKKGKKARPGFEGKKSKK